MRSHLHASIVMGLALAACAPQARSNEIVNHESGSSGSSGGAGSSGSTTGGLGGGGPIGAGGGTTEPAEVFAHTATELFKLDPTTLAVTDVGAFSGCDDEVVDIALDKSGAMFGTTVDTLYRIDRTSAACTPVATGEYPNSLSFVPAGTLDPAEEKLVGFVGATYVEIDPATGAVEDVGSLGQGAGDLVSSGDVVSVIGGGTYLTVNGSDCGDCILEIDPKTGAMKRNIGSVMHGDVFGLAFWAGAAYGFTDSGEVFSIDLDTAATTLVPGFGSTLSFYGAGSTTAAPILPPN